MKLFTAELSRMANRKVGRWLLAALLLFICLFGLLMYQSSKPPSEADLQKQQQRYERELQEWEKNGAEKVQQCKEQEAKEKERGADADFDCDHLGPPKLEDFVWSPPKFSNMLWSIPQEFSQVFTMLSLILGASLICAEFTTGSLSTWLTFEPRRGRVYASKLGATAVGSAVIGVLGLGLSTLAAWVVITVNNGIKGFAPGDVTNIVGNYARALALITMMGILGAAGGFVLRHTAAVVGIFFGYLLVLEVIVLSVMPKLSPFLFSPNSRAFISGRTSYQTQSCSTNSSGEFLCSSTTQWVTWHQATPYLLGLIAALAVLGFVLFKRRDVT